MGWDWVGLEKGVRDLEFSIGRDMAFELHCIKSSQLSITNSSVRAHMLCRSDCSKGKHQISKAVPSP
jgi:hypothetical protein